MENKSVIPFSLKHEWKNRIEHLVNCPKKWLTNRLKLVFYSFSWNRNRNINRSKPTAIKYISISSHGSRNKMKFLIIKFWPKIIEPLFVWLLEAAVKFIIASPKTALKSKCGTQPNVSKFVGTLLVFSFVQSKRDYYFSISFHDTVGAFVAHIKLWRCGQWKPAQSKRMRSIFRALVFHKRQVFNLMRCYLF